MTKTFDYDQTLFNTKTGLPLPKTLLAAKQAITDGDRVIVVTRRSPNQDVTQWVRDNVGKDIKTLFTSGELKADTLNAIGSNKHYDDSPEEIAEINDKYPDIETVLVTEDKKYQDMVACVVDFGTFTSVAHRLAKDIGKVYLFNPWVSGFPLVQDHLVGTGYPDITRVDNLFDIVEECDMFVFPEVGMGDLEMHLEKMGKLVVGSRKAEKLEMSRMGWIEFLEKLGLNTPDTQLVHGIDELQKILETKENVYVKIDDKYRGNFETFRSKTWNTTSPLIDKIRHDLGPSGNNIDFVVQEPITGDLEFGFDTWFAGTFPETLSVGYEIKDRGYVCEIIKYTELPQGILDTLEKIKPTLLKYNYRGFFSAEFRQDDSGKWFFSDPCLRCPNPASAVIQRMCANWAECVVEMANGNIIPPVWNCRYGAELTIRSEWLLDNFGELFAPEDTRHWMNRMNACIIGDAEWTVPKGKVEWYGSVMAMGDDPDQMMKELIERNDSIEGYQLTPTDPGIFDLPLKQLKKS